MATREGLLPGRHALVVERNEPGADIPYTANLVRVEMMDTVATEGIVAASTDPGRIATEISFLADFDGFVGGPADPVARRLHADRTEVYLGPDRTLKVVKDGDGQERPPLGSPSHRLLTLSTREPLPSAPPAPQRRRVGR